MSTLIASSGNTMKSLFVGGISAAPIVGYEQILTVDTFNNYVFLGANMGFWLAVGGGISLLVILLINITKLFKEWFGTK